MIVRMFGCNGVRRPKMLKDFEYVELTTKLKKSIQIKTFCAVLPVFNIVSIILRFALPYQALRCKASNDIFYRIGEVMRTISCIGHNLLDTLLGKRSQHPKTLSNLPPIGLPNFSTNSSLFSRHKQARHLQILAKSFTLGRRVCGPEQHRFASTFTNEVDKGHEAYSMGSFVGTQPIQDARRDIREHLKQWKVAEDEATRNVPSLPGISQPWSRRTVNAISQSGQIDRTHMALDPDEDVETVLQLQTAPTEGAMDTIMPQLFLRPGDLVDINVDGASIVGIVVGEISNIICCYTERGTWYKGLSQHFKFSVPNLVNSQDVSSLWSYVKALNDETELTLFSSMPTAPRDAGSALVAKMAKFLRESDAVFQRYADKITRAYEILPHDDFGSLTSITLEDAAFAFNREKGDLGINTTHTVNSSSNPGTKSEHSSSQDGSPGQSCF